MFKFKRNKKSINLFKVGDLVLLKNDKTFEIYKVEYISEEFCNLKSTKTDDFWGWIKAKNLKLVNANNSKKKKRR